MILLKRVLLKSLVAHIVLGILTFVLYAWFWYVGASWWAWVIVIACLALIYFGYVIAGFMINAGQTAGKTPVACIYALSGILVILTVVFIIVTSARFFELRGVLLLSNFPFILLMEIIENAENAGVITSLFRLKVFYILSSLCPSALIHLGYVIRSYRNEKAKSGGIWAIIERISMKKKETVNRNYK